jgi:hypothetical protein
MGMAEQIDSFYSGMLKGKITMKKTYDITLSLVTHFP